MSYRPQDIIDAQCDQDRDDASGNGAVAAEALRRAGEREQAQKEAAYAREREAARQLKEKLEADHKRGQALIAQEAIDRQMFRSRFPDRSLEGVLLELFDRLERLGA